MEVGMEVEIELGCISNICVSLSKPLYQRPKAQYL